MSEHIVDPAAGCVQVTDDPSAALDTGAAAEANDHCFTIDELWVIAEHFAVPNRAELTDRADLMAAIRSRL